MSNQEKIEHIANHYGFDKQCMIAIEEMSELTKAICKYQRAEFPLEKNNFMYDIEEELADVEIMVRQLKALCHTRIVDGIVDKKLNRQMERIANETD